MRQEDLAWTPGCRQARGSHDPSDLSEDFLDPMMTRNARFPPGRSQREGAASLANVDTTVGVTAG